MQRHTACSTFVEDDSFVIRRGKRHGLARRNASRALPRKVRFPRGFHPFPSTNEIISDRDREHIVDPGVKYESDESSGEERRESARECKVWRAYERVRRRKRGERGRRGGEGRKVQAGDLALSE